MQFGFLLAAVFTTSVAARAQGASTQALVNVDAKSTAPANVSAVTVSVNDRKEPLTAWAPVLPANAQVVFLIDDGLHESLQKELDSLRNFIKTMPPGVEMMVGYMQSGHVVIDQDFNSDHAMEASKFRLPGSVGGIAANPYQCISDLVKRWPNTAASPGANGVAGSTGRKSRFMLLITDGIDPNNTNGNSDSPYVTTAVTDAQRAGVAVYAIHYGWVNGQNYLSQLTQGTGGENLWDGSSNPIAIAPILAQFQSALAQTYIATFPAPVSNNPQRDMVRVKFSAAKAKLHAPEAVHAGN